MLYPKTAALLRQTRCPLLQRTASVLHSGKFARLAAPARRVRAHPFAQVGEIVHGLFDEQCPGAGGTSRRESTRDAPPHRPCA